MFDLVPLFLDSWHLFYSPIDPPPQKTHLCLDMIYQPTKFDVDWSKETQVIIKKNNVWRPPVWHPQSNNQV